MGNCCCTKKKRKQPPEKSLVPESDPRHLEKNQSRDPPLPLEEETVKEVLSETAKPPLPPKLKQETEAKAGKKPPIHINGGDAASEISEICSLSESFSVTTMTDMKDGEEEEVGMRHKETGSQAKFHRRRPVPIRRDFSGRSPSKRSDFSPVRRMPLREGQLVNRPWVPAGSNGVRRDFGENSGRRSPSPARRTDSTRNDLSRSASARKTLRSPRRAPAEEGGWKVEERAEGNESLENPLVSLECFIFL